MGIDESNNLDEQPVDPESFDKSSDLLDQADQLEETIDINDLLSEKDILIQSLQEQIEIKDK